MITALAGSTPASTDAGIVTAIASAGTAIVVLVGTFLGIIPGFRSLRRKLDIVHQLVNSTLTTSIESDLVSTRQSLATMAELVIMRQEAGHDPTPETIAAMEVARDKISHLTQQLADRLETAHQILDGRTRA